MRVDGTLVPTITIILLLPDYFLAYGSGDVVPLTGVALPHLRVHTSAYIQLRIDNIEIVRFHEQSMLELRAHPTAPPLHRPTSSLASIRVRD